MNPSIRHWGAEKPKDKDTFEIRDQAPPVPAAPQHRLPGILGDPDELARQCQPLAVEIVEHGLVRLQSQKT